MIFGIYYNDERATYLDYIQPAFTFDDVAVFVVKGKEFPFTDKNDLIGKKGVTNQGESYGTDFDAFMKDKLDVARAPALMPASKTCWTERPTISSPAIIQASPKRLKRGSRIRSWR